MNIDGQRESLVLEILKSEREKQFPILNDDEIKKLKSKDFPPISMIGLGNKINLFQKLGKEFKKDDTFFSILDDIFGLNLMSIGSGPDHRRDLDSIDKQLLVGNGLMKPKSVKVAKRRYEKEEEKINEIVKNITNEVGFTFIFHGFDNDSAAILPILLKRIKENNNEGEMIVFLNSLIPHISTETNLAPMGVYLSGKIFSLSLSLSDDSFKLLPVLFSEAVFANAVNSPTTPIKQDLITKNISNLSALFLLMSLEIFPVVSNDASLDKVPKIDINDFLELEGITVPYIVKPFNSVDIDECLKGKKEGFCYYSEDTATFEELDKILEEVEKEVERKNSKEREKNHSNEMIGPTTHLQLPYYCSKVLQIYSKNCLSNESKIIEWDTTLKNNLYHSQIDILENDEKKLEDDDFKVRYSFPVQGGLSLSLLGGARPVEFKEWIEAIDEYIEIENYSLKDIVQIGKYNIPFEDFKQSNHIIRKYMGYPTDEIKWRSNLESYFQALRQAFSDGVLVEEEEKMLSTLRNTLNISMDEHNKLVEKLRSKIGELEKIKTNKTFKNVYYYTSLVDEALKDGMIKSEEEQLLNVAKEKLGIKDEIHEQIVVNIQKESKAKDVEIYEHMLKRAMVEGEISKGKKKILKKMRDILDISDEEHKDIKKKLEEE